MAFKKSEIHTEAACKGRLMAVKDALDAINGKWKLPIIIALSEGPLRFKELQRTVENITPKVLSKELKDMELNDFVKRFVYDTTPVTVEYQLTDYSDTLQDVISALGTWGYQHRQHIMEGCKTVKKKKGMIAA
ncbi:MAG: transcriptional regulator [Sphingobacteriales bacterium]|nr:MAG: transcriptional regulator [Sphingobacteriales bacterium]